MLDVDYINRIRESELETVLPYLPAGARVLELGAGSGRQALELSRRGYRVTALDVASSDYAAHRLFPVTEYDGRDIPFPDASFDIVYSSNVLEHVLDLDHTHREISRVLAPGGEAIHVLPTHVWRFWTTAAAFPGAARAFLPRRDGLGIVGRIRRSASAGLKRHGERGNVLSELWLFRPQWWRRSFRNAGFEIVEERPIGLFYTAELLLGAKLDFARRRGLAKLLGSPTRLFRLRTRSPR